MWMKLNKVKGFGRSKQHGHYLLITIFFIKKRRCIVKMHGSTVYTFSFVKSETPLKKANSIKCKNDLNAGKQSHNVQNPVFSLYSNTHNFRY